MQFIPYKQIRIKKFLLYFFTFLFIFFEYIVYKTKNTETSITFAGIGLLILIVILFALQKSKLIIDNNSITQYLFFGKVKTIEWKDVVLCKVQTHYHGHGATVFWNIISEQNIKIGFTPSMYNKRNLQLLAEAIKEKCEHATIDDKIKKIANGKFPWYMF